MSKPASLKHSHALARTLTNLADVLERVADTDSPKLYRTSGVAASRIGNAVSKTLAFDDELLIKVQLLIDAAEESANIVDEIGCDEHTPLATTLTNVRALRDRCRQQANEIRREATR